MADRGTRSLRNRLAKLLARQSDTLIMLSATPHDGKARSFASLVNMLDATAIADSDDYTKEDFRPGLVIRRFKKDVQEQVSEAFKDRQVFAQRFPASPEEEAAYEALLAVQAAGGQPDGAQRDLFIVTLEKALFSSPAACIETVTGRIERREREIARGEDPSPRRAEVAPLRELRAALERIESATCAKYRALLAAIHGGQPFEWQPADPADRLVIFTERIATLDWLKTHLTRDLKLRPGQVETLHGGMSDIDQQRVAEDFGNTQRLVRLLLCSDVASEGINLHYQCHRLIHFDLPWSLMAFQQRNGRVDRYGPVRDPADRLPGDPERQPDDLRRHPHPGSADGEGRAGLQEHRRPFRVHGCARHRGGGEDHPARHRERRIGGRLRPPPDVHAEQRRRLQGSERSASFGRSSDIQNGRPRAVLLACHPVLDGRPSSLLRRPPKCRSNSSSATFRRGDLLEMLNVGDQVAA